MKAIVLHFFLLHNRHRRNKKKNKNKIRQFDEKTFLYLFFRVSAKQTKKSGRFIFFQSGYLSEGFVFFQPPIPEYRPILNIGSFGEIASDIMRCSIGNSDQRHLISFSSFFFSFFLYFFLKRAGCFFLVRKGLWPLPSCNKTSEPFCFSSSDAESLCG